MSARPVPDSQGENVAELQASLTRLGFRIAARERRAQAFGSSTQEALRKFQRQRHLRATGTLTARTAAAVSEAVQALSSTPPESEPGEVSAPHALTSPGSASTAGGQAGTYLVTGQVIAPGSASVAGLAVRLVDKNVGGDVQLTTGTTDYSGGFALRAEIAYAELRKRHKAAPDLQVQVTQGKKLVASSAVSYGAPSEETLNVFLPPGTRGLASEYEALTADIASLYTGSLADLKEDGTQQDITYLANKSGWDARPLAMAIQAARFSQNHRGSPPPSAAADPAKNQRASRRRAAAAAPPEAAPGAAVAPALYYALFRAGMAAEPGDPVPD